MEASVGAHHLSRKLQEFSHDARLMPAKYVRPYSKGLPFHKLTGRGCGIEGWDPTGETT
jgi:hypothetical protein